MNRRDTVLALLALGATPLAAQTLQIGKIPVIGIVTGLPTDPRVLELKQRLHDLGYVEGKNISFEARFWEGQSGRLPSLIEGLVRLGPSVIVANTAQPTSAAMRATSSIPIIFFGVGGDPVSLGLVNNLAQPSGNVTGYAHMANEVIGKQVQLLKEAVPRISHIAFLINPGNPNKDNWDSFEAAARATGVKPHRMEVRESKDTEEAFANVARYSHVGIVVQADPFVGTQTVRIAALAIGGKLPTISSFQTGAEAGYLMSYGPYISDQIRGIASYVDKILKGSKVGDLPVERATKFQLVVNKTTAKALSLKIPPSVLGRADTVIE